MPGKILLLTMSKLDGSLSFSSSIGHRWFDAGYLSYILALPGAESFTADTETLNGGLPFGEGLKHWNERAPVSTVDQVTTPLLVTGVSAFGNQPMGMVCSIVSFGKSC
jgi:hypothetical protein